MRMACPIFTVATWPSVIGVPLRVATTIRDSSLALRTSASERTASPSPLRLTKPPPTLVLFSPAQCPDRSGSAPGRQTLHVGDDLKLLHIAADGVDPGQPLGVLQQGATIQSCAVRR
jgi:hypothetical protein